MIKKEDIYIISNRTKIIGLVDFKKTLSLLISFKIIQKEYKKFTEIRPLTSMYEVSLSSDTCGRIYVIYKCRYTNNIVKQQATPKLARMITDFAWI